MSMLGRILTCHDLPEAELHACRHDGDLIQIGTTWASIAEPEDAVLRAAAFRAAVVDDRLIADRLTAAWIWGGSSRPPLPLQACVRSTARASRRDSALVTVRESVLDADDVARLDECSATTPVRTCLDLLRQPRLWGAPQRDAVSVLMQAPVTAAAVHARLAAVPKAPYTRHAVQRLASLRRLARADAIDVVDGVDPPNCVQHPIEVGGVPHLKHESTECKPL